MACHQALHYWVMTPNCWIVHAFWHTEELITHESPPHNSQFPTLKLRGPPTFPGKEFERYISETKKKEQL